MQRLRLKFGRGASVRFISHLDSIRCWERVFRRASIPLAYTQGFSPHPRIAVAAPLAVGITSNSELMDIWLRKWIPPESAMMLVRRELPSGFTLLETMEVPEGAPALQASVRRAFYRCSAVHPGGCEGARSAVELFLRSDSTLHVFPRGDEMREVDLRPLVHSLVLEAGDDGSCLVDMEVSIGQEGSARPDHVLTVLGFPTPVQSIVRTALTFEWPENEATGAKARRR